MTGKANTSDLAAKADAAALTAKANSADVYLKTETFTKTEVNTALAAKADATALTAKANTADVYTKTEVDTALAGKADDADFTAKANSADVYAKTATYSKTEIDTALTGKADDADLVPYITEANADLKYEPIGAGGGGAWGEITGTLSAQTDLQTALDGKADDADLAAKADAVHTHAFASLTAIPTTFTPPLASGLVVGGHRVGNGLAMAGEYLTVKSANGLKTDSATSYAVEIDRNSNGWMVCTSFTNEWIVTLARHANSI